MSPKDAFLNERHPCFFGFGIGWRLWCEECSASLGKTTRARAEEFRCCQFSPQQGVWYNK